MPKISIYVPDALYAEVRERGVAVSAVAQQALEQAVRRERNAAWRAAAAARAPRTSHVIDTSGLLRDVREEFGE
ncbi:type II toxin-antitoxin system CcdA family antitoxin [Microbacterium sp.]|uniref:type II toxin-antitoxin system CcdA family antitoxin n=1 Tax=Microbacterium sp. TaxID=51671 RepID=UPI003C776D7B